MPVLHLLAHSLMRKSAQNHSSNGGLDVVAEGTLHGGFKVAHEGEP